MRGVEKNAVNGLCTGFLTGHIDVDGYRVFGFKRKIKYSWAAVESFFWSKVGCE